MNAHVDLADVPKPLYVFTNLLNPTTAHNLKLIGSFVSGGWVSATEDVDGFAEKYLYGTVDYLPYVPNVASNQRLLSAYSVTAVNDYTNEYNAELVRRQSFPTLPSRLSATFAFGDYATCEEVSKKYPGWPLASVQEFELVSGPPYTRVARVNMEVVSLMRHATQVSMMTQGQINDVWRHYWSGGGAICVELPGSDFKHHRFASSEIWEYLIEGRIDRIGGPLAPDTRGRRP